MRYKKLFYNFGILIICLLFSFTYTQASYEWIAVPSGGPSLSCNSYCESLSQTCGGVAGSCESRTALYGFSCTRGRYVNSANPCYTCNPVASYNIETYCCCGSECNAGETGPCPLSQGVCAGSVEICNEYGAWPGCDASNYGSNYEYIEITCDDNLDNDCDGQTDMLDLNCYSGGLGKLCPKQLGICEGSYTLGVYCTGVNYGLNYQPVEINCNDGLDNDCDGGVDEPEYCNKYITQYEYDPLGNLVRIVDAEGRVAENNYDSLSRLIYSIHPDIGRTDFTYYLTGTIHTSIDALQRTKTFDYDYMNRLTNIIVGYGS